MKNCFKDWSQTNISDKCHGLMEGTVYSMEWNLGVEKRCGVESNFGVAKNLISPADSVYLTFSNIWTGLF